MTLFNHTITNALSVLVLAFGTIFLSSSDLASTTNGGATSTEAAITTTSVDGTNKAAKDATRATKLLSLCPTDENAVPEALKSLSGIEALSDFMRACISGGEGSGSCSVTAGAGGVEVSCSTSCRDGYYACCGTSGCDCVSSGQKELQSY